MESLEQGRTAGRQAPVKQATVPVKPVARPRRAVISNTGQYQVRRGDTLYSIAWGLGVDYRSLAKWNAISAPYTIYPGQKLKTRAVAQARPAPKKAPPVVRPKPAAKPRPAAPPVKPAPAVPKMAERKPAPAKPSPKPAGNKPVSFDPNRSLKWSWPAAGRMSKAWSTKTPSRGVEIGGQSGQMIRAAEGGKVVYSGNGLPGYGNLVIVKHNARYLSAYGYNRELLVKEGDVVERYQPIARMGLSPEREPALYFEVRRDGRPINPNKVLPKQ